MDRVSKIELAAFRWIALKVRKGWLGSSQHGGILHVHRCH
jgi:hypothetical protein